MPVLTIFISTCALIIATIYISQGHGPPISLLLISEKIHSQYGLFWEVRQGELWRLLTPSFVHFNWSHLLINLVLFAYVAGTLEKIFGSFLLLMLIIILGLPSNITQYLFNGPEFGGLSGIIFGLYACVFMYGLFQKVYIVPRHLILTVSIFYIGGWIPLFGNFANIQHTVGLVAGLISGTILGHHMRKS